MSSHNCHHLLLAARLLLALTVWAEGATTLYFVEDGTIKLLQEGSKTPQIILSGNATLPWALAYDELDNRLYFSEFRRRHINSSLPDGSNRTRLKQLSLDAEPYGMALDSTSRLLFYTDSKYKVIMMQTLKGGLTRTVKKDGLHLPRAITLDTVNGVVYYTDYGLRPSVAMVNYDGSGGRVLIKQDVGLPTGIALDQPADLLYWCDALSGRISSFNLKTKESHIILQLTRVTFLDLKLFNNNLHFSLFNSSYSNIEKLSLDGSNRTTVEMDVNLTVRVTSLAFADSSRPTPPAPPSCPCSHICVPGQGGHVQCLCPDGLFLLPDGLNCSVDANLDNFLLFTDVGLDQLFRIDVDTGQHYPLPIEVENPWGITFNILNNRVYWTEATEKSIHSAYLNGTDQKKIFQMNISSQPSGLDVDAKAGLVFYGDMGQNIIGKLQMDGAGHSIVLSSSLDDPRCLVLDIQDRVIFYTDNGRNPKIGRVAYNGSDARVVVSTNLLSPIGLALDKAGGRLYWCDSLAELIEGADLDGRNRVRMVQFLYTHHYALTLFQGVIYFADLNVRYIHQIGTHSVGYSAFSENAFFFIVDLHAVDRNKEREIMGYPTVVPPPTTTPLSTNRPPPTSPPGQQTASTTARTTSPTLSSVTSFTTRMTTRSTAVTTMTTTTSKMNMHSPAAQTGAVQSAGYSAGAMAGAIFGTILLLLAILALVAVILYKRRHITLHRASPEGGTPGGMAFFNPMSEPYRTLEEEGGPGGHHNPAMVFEGAAGLQRTPPPTYSSAQGPSKAELALALGDAGASAVGGATVTQSSYGKE